MKYRVPPVLAVAASALVVPTSTPAVAIAKLGLELWFPSTSLLAISREFRGR
jgi:hypothetical protein